MDRIITTALNNPLKWEESFDDDDNSIWEASGPYGDEGGSCIGLWRIRQLLRMNHILWVEDHDAELRDEFTSEQSWPTLESAKKDIERIHHEILESYEE